jgi:hypothetical protein
VAEPFILDLCRDYWLRVLCQLLNKLSPGQSQCEDRWIIKIIMINKNWL